MRVVAPLALLLFASPALAQDEGPYRAVSGSPFLAYVGDSVQLSAEWSTGPEPRTYAWTQIEGPPVELDDPSAERPRFTVSSEGTHAFHVTVGTDEVRSQPALALVHVVGTDLHRGRGEREGGCMALPLTHPLPWGLGILGILLLRRRP
ncbi:MAG: hypothetical protein EA397_18195 [Deltaproteobacteria bacterium]|nr:MAG: hypothetical protein EA397_18195 [Deltaproteobacteria bacterium]